MSQSLSSSLFGGAVGGEGGGDEVEAPMQTGRSNPKYTGPGSFASQGKGNFTTMGKALSVRNDVVSTPGKVGGLVFEGIDPSNPWGQ